MRQPHTPPVASPRDFGLNEAFFSCTDARGVIEGGNAVFMRISGYSESELLRKPHNLIRHPDVPRVVFRMLWSTINAGQPIAAYVKNMAKDGRYYWVLAMVSPIPDGHLSVRFRPSSGLLPVVQDLYKRMRDTEIAAEAAGKSGEATMDASQAVLVGALTSLGFADYGAFMRTALLPQELAARDEGLARERLTLFSDAPIVGSAPVARALQAASLAQRQRYAELTAHQLALAGLPALEAQLVEATRGILDQTADLGFLALNISINASKLGPAGKGIGVVAEHLRNAANEIARIVEGVRTRVATISKRLAAVIFSLGWLRVQFEMAVMYTDEIAAEAGRDAAALSGEPLQRRIAMLRHLREAFDATAVDLSTSFADVASELRRLENDSDGLDRAVDSMLVAQVAGTIEAHRLKRENPIREIFSEAHEKSSRTNESLQTLHDIATRLLVLAKGGPSIVRDVQRGSRQLELDTALLSELNAAHA